MFCTKDTLIFKAKKIIKKLKLLIIKSNKYSSISKR